MASEELGFLHRNRPRVIQLWREYVVSHVNSRFFEYQDFVDEGLLDRLFTYIVQALEQNHYYDLNRTFDAMLDRAHRHFVGIGDVRGVLFGFIDATERVLHQHADPDSPLHAYLRRRLAQFSSDLKRVYSERLAGTAVEQLRHHCEHIEQKWLRDLPTSAVSRHFVVVSEERRRQFVSETFAVATEVLSGEVRSIPSAEGDDGKPVSAVEVYLKGVIDFFEPRGFAISDVERAIRYLEEISEPILFRLYESDAHAYRRALWVVHSAVSDLALAFAEGYNQRMMKNYYNEVSIMLHRIKNKLTAVPTSLLTVMTNTYEGIVVEGDVLTVRDAEALEALQEARKTALQAGIKAIEGALAQIEESGAAESMTEAMEILRGAVAAFDDLKAFIRRNKDAIKLLQQKLDPDAIGRVEEFLSDALEGGDTTTKLTKELQDIQNELYKREAPVWQPVHLNELLREAYSESVVDARGKEIDYTLDVPPLDVYVFGVQRTLKLPFTQVINNAIKYTPEKGTVRVAMEAEGGYVTVSVHDSGIGIPKGEENLVFGLCERCSNAKEVNKDGSGTGLYNDRKTILQHNGDMWVESEGEGRGSTFYIRLPIFDGNGVPRAVEDLSVHSLSHGASDPAAASA